MSDSLKKNSKTKWIEAGYELFAMQGPDGIDIKHLAEIAQLPRTNFYYHFNDKEDLIEQVLESHMSVTENFMNMLYKDLVHFLPDLHVINMNHEMGLRFMKQLFLNRHRAGFDAYYLKLIKISTPTLVPKMLDYYKLQMDFDVAESLWETVIDTWYARMDVNKLSVAYLSDLTETIMKSVFDFTRP